MRALRSGLHRRNEGEKGVGVSQPSSTRHSCPTCGDSHMVPQKFDADELRAAGWSEDYIERHARHDALREKGAEK